MCCSGPKWKREIVPDHKFDFVDTTEFADNGFFMRLKYLFLYLIVLKSFMVYMSDIFTAITMISSESWSNEIFQKCSKQNGTATATSDDNSADCIAIPFEIGKWLFVGCIIFSFLLLGYESWKARRIIHSRDISYAFTNVLANNYYSLRSYNHFCFFDHISNSTKTSDDFAFFVFFVFKSWKRLLLADGPRQTINALTLYAVYLSHEDDRDPVTNQLRPWYDVSKYFDDNKNFTTTALTITTFFTVTIFAGSLLLLIVAGICYVPLLMHIRGNLKEYCCHKVDKRISAVIKRRQKQRLADAAKLAQKEAMGDYSHLKNKKGELVGKPLPQPTLPNLSVDDDFDDASSMHTRGPPPSTYTSEYNYYPDKGGYPPPMPAYNPYSTHQPPGSVAHFNPSQPSFDREDSLYNYPYETTNDSSAHLTSAAAPFAHPDRPGSVPPPMSNPYSPGGNNLDPRDVYQGYATGTPGPDRRPSPQPSQLAYDGYGSNPSYSQGYSNHPPDNSYHQGYGHASDHSAGYGGYHGYGADQQSIHDQSSARRGHDGTYGGGGGGGGHGGFAM
ncbi:Potassium transporter [Marasmius crinis-equi]|uniref:Potassium transporter n=1 Tax=Marasmius crinis-equi TaxID=585013 RepID=A0ABR3G2F1_9AGAR